MSILIRTYRSIKKLFTHTLYFLSHLFPRSKNIWVFVGWHNGKEMEIFADNSKYLFLHTSNSHKEIKSVWIAKDKKLASLLRSRGLISYSQNSLLGIWHSLRAGTTIIDAFLKPENYRWSGRTRLIQLLHGKGMKKKGYSQKPIRKQNVIFSTSPFVNSLLTETFKQESEMVVSGYPRADVLFREIKNSDISVDEVTRDKLGSSAYKKRFLYAPTFRRGVQEINIEDVLDLETLSKWLTENSFLFAISLHPKYAHQVRDISYENIHFVEESDIYPLLRDVDVLIGDYGSLFTDFLLLDRPLVFYPYDIKEYSEKEGFCFDYEKYTPGPKAYSPSELILKLKEVTTNDKYIKERTRVRAEYHTYQDGFSSQRILNFLVSEK